MAAAGLLPAPEAEAQTTPTLSISIAETSAAEQTPNSNDVSTHRREFTVTVTASQAPGVGNIFSFDLGLTGTATIGTDFDFNQNTTTMNTFPKTNQTIGGTDTTYTRTIEVEADDTVEPDETITLTLTKSTRVGTVTVFPDYDLGTASATFTILNDDFLAAADAGATIFPTTLALTEGGAAKTYELRLNHDPGNGRTVTVTPASSDPGAATVSGALTFTGGTSGNWEELQTVTVTPVDDGDRTDETVSITNTATVDNSSGAYDNTNIGTVSATVEDDDALELAISLTPTSAAEGNSGTRSYTVNLTGSETLSGAQGFWAVDYTVTGTATIGTDYDILRSGSVDNRTSADSTFRTSTSFVIRVNGDTTEEPDETVTLTFTRRSGFTDYAFSTPTSVTFTITNDDAGAPREISVGLPPVEGVPRNSDGQQVHGETVGSLAFTVSATPAPVADLTVCVRVTESTGVLVGDRVDSAAEGVKSVTILGGAATATHAVTVADTAADDRDSVLTVTAVVSSTAGCGSTASYTISSSDASDAALLRDDEATLVSLASTDTDMTEGSAGHAATVTVSLSRRLYAGEVVAAPLVLSSSTGARLPGHATPDFSVSGSGAGVAAAGLASANPTLTFTGHDTNAVQTATVVFAPVSGRDDGDTAHDLIVFSVASNAVLGASGTDTNVSGRAARGATFMYTLLLRDDEHSGDVLGADSLRLSERSSVGYTVTLDVAVPSGETVTVAVAKTGAHTGAANVSPSSLTFTSSNWTEPKVVSVTGVDEAATHRDRALTLTHTATSTDTSSSYHNRDLGSIPVTVADAAELEVYHHFVFENRSAWDDVLRRSPRQTPWSDVSGLSFKQDLLLPDAQDYFVRLSNRPQGTVTVTARTANAARAHLALGRHLAHSQTLTFTFHDREPGAGGCDADHEDADGATSWRCVRKVFVIRTAAPSARGCTDIAHTVSGGGSRKVTGGAPPGALRAHVLGMEYTRGGVTYRGPDFSRPLSDCQQMSVTRNYFYGPLTPSMVAANNALPTQLGEDSDGGGVPGLELPEGTAAAVPVVEGTSTGLTVDLGRVLGAGERAELELVFSGATPGADYTLSLASGTAVTVKATAPLTGAKPVLVFGEGAQKATLTIAVADDAEYEEETLTVAFGTLRHSVKDRPDKETTPEGSVAFALIDTSPPPLAITGLADASVAENAAWSAAPVLEGVTGAVTWALGGADAARFTLDARTGALTLPAQDFEAPADADKDNVYEATLSATDPGGTDSVAFEVTVTDVAEGCVTADTALVAEVAAKVARHETTGRADLLEMFSRSHRTMLGKDSYTTVAIKARPDKAGANWQGAGPSPLWRKVYAELDRLETCRAGTTTADPTPAVSIAAGAGITEGSNASFTLTAKPAPAAALTVSVTVAQSGDYAASGATGTKTVTILKGETTATYTVATVGDDADEPDGSVTVTLAAGQGYTVGTANTATVAVSDDDDPPAGTATALPGTAAAPVSNGAVLVARPAGWAGPGKAQVGGGAKARDRGSFTNLAIANAGNDGFEVTWTSRAPGTLRLTLEWQPLAGSSWQPSDGGPRDPRVLTVEDPAAVQPDPDPQPTVTIAGGSGVTEGGTATFTVTASPAPASPLTVTLAVGQSGNYAASGTTGTKTVTIPTTGSAPHTVATVDDQADEADGTVTVTVSAGQGYTVGAANTATVSVSDDDDPPAATPAVSVSAGPAVTEGGTATFTVTASPAPASPLTVTLAVGHSGDFAASGETGTKTVTIPTTGSAPHTVATVDDDADEADGSVAVTVSAGQGYTVGSPSSATVAVADDDPPPPSVDLDAPAPSRFTARTISNDDGTLDVLIGWPASPGVTEHDLTARNRGDGSATHRSDYTKHWYLWEDLPPGSYVFLIEYRYRGIVGYAHDNQPGSTTP